ncbi:MAG: YqaJ viral recombinase family protein [Nitrospirales bacterium]
MSDRELFHARRREVIGGSDVGAIVGVDPWKTQRDVYHDKVKPRESTRDIEEPTPYQTRGLVLEPIVAELYVEQTGLKVSRGKFRRHPVKKFLGGHPDGVINPQPGNDERGILECKTMTYGAFQQIVRKGIPERWQLQGQHYCTVSEASWVDFAVLTPDHWKFVVVRVEALRETQDRLIEVCTLFWENYVLKQTEPPEEAVDYGIEIPEGVGVVETRSGAEWLATLQDYADFKQMEAETKNLRALNRESLIRLCGRHGLFEGGKARVHYRQAPGKAGGLDRDKLLRTGLLDGAKLQQALEDQGYHLTLDELSEIREAAVIDDLAPFQKPAGKPFDELRVFFPKDMEG